MNALPRDVCKYRSFPTVKQSLVCNLNALRITGRDMSVRYRNPMVEMYECDSRSCIVTL